MTNQIVDPLDFGKKAQYIRLQVASVLKRWGLLPRFKRWRLTQDPDTGMAVLFGILNNQYIATHTSTAFSDYFAPSLLRDLSNILQVQVVSCNSDTLRYAFILERGQIETLPTHIDYPFTDGDQLFARVIYPKVAPVAEPDALALTQPLTVDQGLGTFLKVFDSIKRKEPLNLRRVAQKVPSILLIDETEFDKRVAAHEEANRLRNQQVKALLSQQASG